MLMQRAHPMIKALAIAFLACACTENEADSLASGPAKVTLKTVAPRVDSGKVKLSLSATDTAKFRHFMADKKITDRITYKSPDLDTAQVIDTILISKALTLGGMDADLEFTKIPNSERERAMVLAGDVAIAGTSQWDWWADENKDVIYKSDVVVPNGSFEKGLYTTEARVNSIVLNSTADLANVICVTNKIWRVDWTTLSRLHFKHLDAAPNTETMFKMVNGGHADLTIQSFSGLPDMSITVSGITLYPIKGWKVLLDGSRHYVVSKKNPHGARVFEALQKGLSVMKQTDEVARALTESGFFNVNVKNWKSIQSK
jgi:hypothetical protein